MNEQHRADALGALLDGASPPLADLPAEDRAFAEQLMALAGQARVDETFAAVLEGQLRAGVAPLEQANAGITARFGRRYYRVAALAAALLALTFAALALPAARDVLFPAAVTEESLVVTSTVALSPPPAANPALVRAPIKGGFRIMGEVMNVDRLYLGLMESTLTAYVDLMWSPDNEPVQS